MKLPITTILFLALLCAESVVFAEVKGSVYVPVDDPIYDFLEICIVKDMLPVWSINVRPVSRQRIGEILQLVKKQYSPLDNAILEAELNYYLREFGHDIAVGVDTSASNVRILRSIRYQPERTQNEPHWHAAVVEKDRFSLIFDPLIWFSCDGDEEKSIFRRATGIQFRGAYKSIGYYFKFVDHVERGNGPYLSRDDLLEDRFGYVGPLQGSNETYYDMTEAYLAADISGIDIVFGKERVAWGPARGSGLLLSGLSPSFNQLRVHTELFNKVRFGYILGCLHAWNAPVDTLYQIDRGWTRISRPHKWIAAHRVEYTPLRWMSLAVNESIIWGDRGLDWSYVNPINFYFSAEHDGDDQDNVLMSGDFTVRVAHLGLVYGELLIDDMKLSALGEGDPSNKFGVVIGGRFLDTGVDGLTTGVEYARLDPYVYTHFYPVNRYSTWTSSLGSGLTGNSDRLRWWVDYKFRRNLGFRLDLDHNRRGEVGSDPYDSIERNYTGTIDFLDGNPESWVSAAGLVKWEPLTGVVIEAGWINGDKRSFLANRFFLEAGYRY